MWKMCPRKWGYQYLLGIKEPPHKSAVFGTEVHAVLEDYFRDGTAPNLGTNAGKLASSGLHLYLNPNSVITQVEEKFEFTFEGIRYGGYIDLQQCDEQNNIQYVFDHKTSSNPHKWGLTPKSFISDIQRNIYGMHSTLGHDPDLMRVITSWIYYNTKGKPKPYTVSHECNHHHERFLFRKNVVPHAIKIQEAYHLNVVDDLEQKSEACSAFGGCPHIGRCKPKPQSISHIFTTLNNDERIKKMATGIRARMAKIKEKKAAEQGKQQLQGRLVNPHVEEREPFTEPEQPEEEKTVVREKAPKKKSVKKKVAKKIEKKTPPTTPDTQVAVKKEALNEEDLDTYLESVVTLTEEELEKRGLTVDVSLKITYPKSK